ncbi:MAG TPA: hypothetical protein VIM11_17360 [Tepidisphaeraceae bacterium]|jgi:hypothetical protein
MPNRPALDKPTFSDAHVPWESIDEVEGESECEETSTPVDAPSKLGAQRNAAPDLPSEHEEDPAPRSRIPDPLPPSKGGGWTLPVLCAGIALIACCALIPQADANRRLAYERQTLQMDIETVEKQIAVNQSFLKKVGEDPTLAERLAQRQMKVVPQGTRVLELPHEAGTSMSPFQLVNVSPPPPLPPYKPVGGFLARLCYDAHSRLYLIGISLGMIATGLVLGSTPER